MGLYDRYLALRIRLARAQLPERVALVITEADLLEAGAFRTLSAFLEWAYEYDATRIMIYVRVRDEEGVSALEREFSRLESPEPVAVRTPSDDQPADSPVQVSLGLGGKHEFAAAAKSIAEDVDRGILDVEDISETAVEERLVFPSDPDLIIKTGAERLSDFMIWQSVYAELHFTDVNWRNFRRRDYLRALRDYQSRQRRFGR